jgi:uncharacterized sulfatase
MRWVLAATSFLASLVSLPGCSPSGAEPPNIVLVVADDLGYGDLGVYGAAGFPTPSLDRLARDGIRLTDFYVASPACTPSRAAMMTGSHPIRVGLEDLLFPGSIDGIASEEITLAEILRWRGYRTGCVGKWHLGAKEQFWPSLHGFDFFFGLLFSHDMLPSLALYRDERRVGQADRRLLTQRFTEEAVRFIEQSAGRPFFLYLAHAMPHQPLGVSPAFEGSSGRGEYGDVVREIDASVGEILRALERLGIDERTLVAFTSDNGPWRRGSAGPLRGGKGTSWEGGVRVPFVARWPGQIPPGSVSSEITSAMDLLPTLALLAGASAPADRVIDGRDIRGVLLAGAPSPHETIHHYLGRRLAAVRSGRFKLHVSQPELHLRGDAARLPSPLLYDLAEDPGEEHDLAPERPEVVERLLAVAERSRAVLGDESLGRVGSDLRNTGASGPRERPRPGQGGP